MMLLESDFRHCLSFLNKSATEPMREYKVWVKQQMYAYNYNSLCFGNSVLLSNREMVGNAVSGIIRPFLLFYKN